MDNNDFDNDNRPQPEEIKELLDEQPPHVQQKNASLAGGSSQRGLDFLYDVPLQISVEVGRAKILLKDMLRWVKAMSSSLTSQRENRWISMSTRDSLHVVKQLWLVRSLGYD